MGDLENLKNWVVDHIRGVTFVVAGVVGVLILGALVSAFMKHREQSAVEALYTARQAVDVLSPDKRVSEGKAILEKVADQNSHTRAAYEALLGIGDIYTDAKNYADAATYYQKAVAAAPDDFARVMALYDKAGAEEFAGNCAAAIQSYADLEKQKGAAFLQPEAMLAQGRCHETLKEYAKAGEIYKKIQDQFPNNSYYSGAAQVFLDKLKPQMKN